MNNFWFVLWISTNLEFSTEFKQTLKSGGRMKMSFKLYQTLFYMNKQHQLFFTLTTLYRVRIDIKSLNLIDSTIIDYAVADNKPYFYLSIMNNWTANKGEWPVIYIQLDTKPTACVQLSFFFSGFFSLHTFCSPFLGYLYMAQLIFIVEARRDRTIIFSCSSRV